MTEKKEKNRELAEQRVNYQKEQVVSELKRLARLMDETAGDLRKRADEILSEREDETVNNVHLVTWAINDVENMMRNLNFNHLSFKLARLVEAETRLKDC